jgi:hypothetical protein
MKKILIGLTLITSMNLFASECGKLDSRTSDFSGYTVSCLVEYKSNAIETMKIATASMSSSLSDANVNAYIVRTDAKAMLALIELELFKRSLK